MKSRDETQQRDELICQRAIKKKAPTRQVPTRLLYLCLVPSSDGTGLSLRYHQDRVDVKPGDDGMIVFGCEIETKPREKNPVNFEIVEDSYVLIELYENYKWRFSQEFAGMVMKNKADRKFYGELRYAEKPEGPFYCKSEIRDGMSIRYLRFVAKYNKLPKGQFATHPYCLNMEFLMDGNGEEWVPITLDPDIENPPHGGHD